MIPVRTGRRKLLVLLCLVGAGHACGCANQDGDSGYDLDSIKFVDTAESNARTATDLAALEFVQPGGEPIQLQSLSKGRILVVVVTRGHTGSICPYCSAQTSRLISAYPEFSERGAEVVVVYPVVNRDDAVHLEEFLEATTRSIQGSQQKVPFPVLLDVELKAVDLLGIRRNLSKPATYILDRQSQVRFAYVGATLADRPSVKALLTQVDAINAADPVPAAGSGPSAAVSAVADRKDAPNR